jgi:hypothetical protein
MATISSLGIGSGLDSESIVTKLVELEKLTRPCADSYTTKLPYSTEVLEEQA